MTKLEAVERANKIWGEQVADIQRVIWKGCDPGPGDSEWNVVLHSGSWHSFDCNGHPTCHHDCDLASVEVCL